MRDGIPTRDGQAGAAGDDHRERSRREVMAAGIVTGSAVVASSAAPSALGAGAAFTRARGEADLVEAAVELERRAALAYDTAARSGQLDRRSTGVAKLFARHERQHAEALADALEALGRGAPSEPRRPRSVAGLDEALRRGQDAIARFAVGLEDAALATYDHALANVTDPGLLSTIVSIMAAEGQHLVVLRGVLGREQVPRAFGTGPSGSGGSRPRVG